MTVSVRCTPEWHARWVAAAAEEQRSLSNAIALVMNRWADEVLEKKRRRLAAQAAREQPGAAPEAPAGERAAQEP